jgi:hypothetical protein
MLDRLSYRCSCKDLHTTIMSIIKLINFSCTFLASLMMFHIYVYHMCEILILTHMMVSLRGSGVTGFLSFVVKILSL